MRKIICILLSLMLFTSVAVSAAGLEFLNDASMMRMEASEAIRFNVDIPPEVIEVLLGYAEDSDIDNYVDLESILEGLASGEQDVQTQVIISEDFKRVQLGMLADNRQSIHINVNANVQIDTKYGLWIDYDMTDENHPMYKLIYTMPSANKYVVLDLFEMMNTYATEEERAQVLQIFKMMYNKDFIDPLLEQSLALIEKHASVQFADRKCTVHFDSKGFSAYLADIINMVIDSLAYMEAITPEEADEAKLAVLTYAPSISLLGDEGLTMTYSLTSKKIIQSASATASFEICLKDIFALFDPSGESWPSESDGVIKMQFTDDIKIQKRGDAVSVAYPTLTEENSISYADYLGLVPPSPEEENDEEEYVPSLPNYYAGVYADALPVINGKVYVPLRAILSDAYNDEFAIDFAQDETITITSTWFDNVQTKVGDSWAHVNGEAIWVDPVILENDTTYVSQAFFENVFGWELAWATHDLVSGQYSCFFWTSEW